MSLLLFYDFETNGLPDFKAPSEAPHQPHIVQLAALLVDSETRATIAGINLIAKPDGWVIGEEIAAIHGITSERATSVGVGERSIVDALYQLWLACETRVGHNEQFDARIMRIALKRFGYVDTDVEKFGKGTSACTANMATPILKLPPTPKMVAAGINKFKTANLSEAYAHFIGKPFENAHSALADVKACMAVYFAIKGTV